MKEKLIRLSRGQFATVSPEDFEEISKYPWHALCDLRSNTYYAVRNSPPVEGKRGLIFMHRMIMGDPQGLQVDHINGDTLDNRRENLRPVTLLQNIRNRGKFSNNKSGFKGVSRNHTKWQARIRVDRKLIYLGTYNTPLEAHAVYCEAAKKYFGEFWRAA